LTAGLSFITV